MPSKTKKKSTAKTAASRKPVIAKLRQPSRRGRMQPSRQERAFAAPVTTGSVITTRARRPMRHVEPLDFSGTNVATDGVGNIYFIPSSRTSVPAGANTIMDLNPVSTFDPVSSSTAPNWATFGPVIRRLAQCYSRFELRNMSVEYIPATTTNIDGQIALGFTPEPFSYNYASYPQVASLQNNILTPVWQRASMQMDTSSIEEPRYVSQFTTDSSTVSDERLTAYGQLFVAKIGSIPVSKCLGSLRFRGTLILYDLFDQSINQLNPAGQASLLPTYNFTSPDYTLGVWTFSSTGQVASTASSAYTGPLLPISSSGTDCPFSFAPSAATFTIKLNRDVAFSTARKYSVLVHWSGTGISADIGNPTVLGTGTLDTGIANYQATDGYYHAIMGVTAVGDGLTYTAPTGLADGVLHVSIRSRMN